MHDMHAFVCIKGYFVLAGPKNEKLSVLKSWKKSLQKTGAKSISLFCFS